MGGFVDSWRMVLGWWSGAASSPVAGAFLFPAAQVFLPGPAAAQVFLPGPVAAQTFSPGPAAAEVLP